jgi:hypothetical protein
MHGMPYASIYDDPSNRSFAGTISILLLLDPRSSEILAIILATLENLPLNLLLRNAFHFPRM